jgi:hypothetical protein
MVYSNNSFILIRVGRGELERSICLAGIAYLV